MRANSVSFMLFNLIFFCTGFALAQTTSDNTEQTLSENKLRAHVKFLSDDLLGGRAPGSVGSKIAQKYISTEMESFGLKPAFENGTSYLQPFNLVKINVSPNMDLSFSKNGQQLSFDYYKDFVSVPGVQKKNIKIENAELVFVGYGIQASEFKWDDFKNTDVKGKVLLIMNNDPDNGDPNFFGGKARLYYGRWDYKYEQAAKMGAAGAIIIHTTPSAGYPWQVVQSSWSRTQVELPKNTDSPLLYEGWITEEAAYKVLKLSGKDLDQLRKEAEDKDFKPVPLGVSVNASINADYSTFKGANIGGLLPGSDSKLKDEVVVFTAHYDHLGIGKPVKGDSIYNGALDNASGVSSILTLAEAFSRMDIKPKRSLLFLAVDCEESGLLGSQYFVEHPTFKPSQIAADINIDGINIWGKTHDVAIIGYGKSNIDDIVKSIAKSEGRVVVPDPTPEKGSFYRSDQLNFAKAGVPVLYMDSGHDYVGRPKGWGDKVVEEWVQKTYHQPSDEYKSSWDLSGEMQDLHLLFETALHIANQNEMPAWTPGDEFESARKNSL